MRIRFFNPAEQYWKYQHELDNAWKRIANGGDLILRDDVQEFEGRLSYFVGTEYAVAVNR